MLQDSFRHPSLVHDPGSFCLEVQLLRFSIRNKNENAPIILWQSDHKQPLIFWTTWVRILMQPSAFATSVFSVSRDSKYPACWWFWDFTASNALHGSREELLLSQVLLLEQERHCKINPAEEQSITWFRGSLRIFTMPTFHCMTTSQPSLKVYDHKQH
jgi:hypothetical protein